MGGCQGGEGGEVGEGVRVGEGIKAGQGIGRREEVEVGEGMAES